MIKLIRDHSLVKLNETMSHAVKGHPRWMGHGGEFWKNMVHWERNGKPRQYSCRKNSMNSMKRLKYRTLKDELPRSVGAQHATKEEWRNNSRKNEETELKQKHHPAVDVTGDRNKF